MKIVPVVAKIIIAAAIAVILLPMAAKVIFYRPIKPDPNESFEQSAERHEFERIFRLENQDGTFYMAEAPWPPADVLQSGPPVFVFDSTGRLVDWTSDSGDAPSFTARWDKWRATEITLQQALAELSDKVDLTAPPQSPQPSAEPPPGVVP